MTRPRMLLIKTGSAFEGAIARFGDFDEWFENAIGPTRFDYDTVAVSEGERLPDPSRLNDWAGAIVTGSAAMVSHRLDWSERAAAWLAEVIGVDRLPVLGVCYGHQLIAHALGGRVGPNPAGRRMGTRTLKVLAGDDPLIGGLAPRTRVHVTHEEVVLAPPAAARVLGRTEGDDFHVLQFGARCWGVQFHPEFNAAIMRCYIRARADALDAEGFDSQAILEAVTETLAGGYVLDAFTAICEQSQQVVTDTARPGMAAGTA